MLSAIQINVYTAWMFPDSFDNIFVSIKMSNNKSSISITALYFEVWFLSVFCRLFLEQVKCQVFPGIFL